MVNRNATLASGKFLLLAMSIASAAMTGNVFADDSTDEPLFQEWKASEEQSERLREIIKTIGGDAKLRVSTHAGDIPDIYRADPEKPGRFIPREKTVTISAFEVSDSNKEYMGFRCAPFDDLFYVEHRSKRRDPKSERVFGPFSGSPLELFPEIERRMLKDIARGDTNPFICMREIARVGHSGLNARVLKMVDKVLLLQMEFKEKVDLVRSAEEVLSIARESSGKQFLEQADVDELLTAIDKKLTLHKEKVDDLTLEFPEDDYIKALDMPKTKRINVEESLWGKPVDGLQFAVVPEKTTLKLEEQVHVKLVVKNVSDGDIKFSVHDLIQDVGPEVMLHGKRVMVGRTWFSGWPPTNRYLLKPGDQFTLAGSHIIAHAEDVKKKDRAGFGVTSIPVSDDVLADNASMNVDYTMSIGHGESWRRCEDDVMRVYSPAKGEWKGRLDAGGFEIKFER